MVQEWANGRVVVGVQLALTKETFGEGGSMRYLVFDFQ